MIPRSSAFYQGGITRFLVGNAASPGGIQETSPGIGPGGQETAPNEPGLTDYQKAVIRYYKSYGYIPNRIDRLWYQNFIANYEVLAIEEGEEIQVKPRDDFRDLDNRYSEPEDLGLSKYHWTYGSGYTDETLPQAHGEDWWRKS